MRTSNGIVTRIRPDNMVRRVEDFEFHRTMRIGGEIVVDDTAGRGILTRGQFRRPWRRIVHAKTHAYGRRRLDKISCSVSFSRADGRGLPQRSNVIENPESAAVGAGHEIRTEAFAVVFHLKVAYGDRRHV